MKRLSPTVTSSLLTAALLPSFLPSLHAQMNRTLQKDWALEGKVQNALRDPALAGSSILSSVKEGVVKLSGTVHSEAAKELASSDLATIPGVKTVLNNLSIQENTVHAVAPPPPKPAAGPSGPKQMTLPSGTALPVRLQGEIDTKTAKAGDTFEGTTASMVIWNGYTLVPSGSPVTGRIIEAKAAGHFSGAAALSVELVSIKLPEAEGVQSVSLVTQPLSSKANGRGTNTAEKAGGGAALGALVGALAGGGTGAGVGAASGGALGLGANAITRGKEIDLKPEQLLQFRTAAPLAVVVMLHDGHQVLPGTSTGVALQSRPVEQSQ